MRKYLLRYIRSTRLFTIATGARTRETLGQRSMHHAHSILHALTTRGQKILAFGAARLISCLPLTVIVNASF